MKTKSIYKISKWQILLLEIIFIMVVGLVISPEHSHAQSNETQKNKKIVTDFYTLAFIDKKLEEAYDRYVGDNYIQHNPNVPDGKKASLQFHIELFNTFPQMKVSVKRIIAEDNLVVVHQHSKSTPEDPGMAIMAIFRVADGKIVEHWDVFQTVPENSANDNTMF